MALGREKVTSLAVDDEPAAEVLTDPGATFADAAAWVASSTVTEEAEKEVPGGATMVTVAPGASAEKGVKPMVYSTPVAPAVLCDSDTAGLVTEVPMPTEALTAAAVGRCGRADRVGLGARGVAHTAHADRQLVPGGDWGG